MKTFRDIKPGDNIYYLKYYPTSPKQWIVDTYNVISIREGSIYIRYESCKNGIEQTIDIYINKLDLDKSSKDGIFVEAGEKFLEEMKNKTVSRYFRAYNSTLRIFYGAKRKNENI